MDFKVCIIASCAALAGLMVLFTGASAQQRGESPSSRLVGYEKSRETLLQGTVLSYSEDSPLPPIGAHATIQTAGGTVDVHLGPATYLGAHHFSFAPGDSVGFVGTMSRQGKGNVFLARIAQKGSQTIAIRSTQGFLLATAAARSMSEEQRAQLQQVGAR